MPITIERAYVSPIEAAEHLGISVREVYRHITAGRLPASRLSHKAIRIAVADLDAFVEARRIPASVAV